MVRVRYAAPLVLFFIGAGGVRAEPLDAADEAFRATSYRQAWAGALGQAQRWSNPASGHAGSVLATKEQLDPATHQPCREVTETLSAGDRPAVGYAVGCRTADGRWQIVQTSAAANPSTSVVPADVTPYVAPADISADGSGREDPNGLPAQVRIYVPWRGAPGAVPPTPR
jgi:hypothetical protein